MHSFKVSRKREKTPAHTQRNQYGLGTWEESLLSSTEHQHWCPRKRGIYLLVFDIDILYSWSVCSFFNNCKQMSSVCLTGHQQAVLLAQNLSTLPKKPEDFPMPPCVNIYQLDKFSQSCFDKQMSPVQLWG